MEQECEYYYGIVNDDDSQKILGKLEQLDENNIEREHNTSNK